MNKLSTITSTNNAPTFKNRRPHNLGGPFAYKGSGAELWITTIIVAKRVDVIFALMVEGAASSASDPSVGVIKSLAIGKTKLCEYLAVFCSGA